jgi:hypothetical protein
MYEAYVPTFRGSWSYVIGCKTRFCGNRFMDNSAAVDLALRQRLLPQIGHGQTDHILDYDDDKLAFFDGAQMELFQTMPKAWENTFCLWDAYNNTKTKNRKDTSGLSYECSWVGAPSAEDGKAQSEHESFLTLQDTPHGKSAVATRDIEAGERLGLYDAATSLSISRAALDRAIAFAEEHDSSEHKIFVDWLLRHGYGCEKNGGEFLVPMASLLSFVNHGCTDGELNVDRKLQANMPGVEHTADDDDDTTKDKEDEDDDDGLTWHAVQNRNARAYCTETRANKILSKGAPLVGDHRSYDWDGKAETRKASAAKMCATQL